MMLGSQMEIVMDEGGGRTVGSRVRMSGKVMGIPLSLRKSSLRENRLRKAWETSTRGPVVNGQYRLGFELELIARSIAASSCSCLRLPAGP